ncbi:hypothetical protein C1886_04855 [Pseudomonas sp. FW300-N1A1]|uniref:DUF4435 domain-containing protein n=1 Tax=Pseudomonas sp. FW300-N1A1 TaxID=2075555 RepID=UPI000CCFE12A|nr:DUF4435 domain-containing protein [Pseudomonas sp. FW300-N1A1]POA21603.1 hypothetical protein C1886_04855 [Pseudomonas sp. FW300-N1A1]
MDLKYDISEYIAMARMSSKIRILVEGKDDRGHVLNLLKVLTPKVKLKIDIAVDIAGECKLTSSNNRAKIESIHFQCKGNNSHRKLFFLCDREFRNFSIEDVVKDFSSTHEVDGNLSWTLGHSIENYFLSPYMLSEGFRYLSGSGSKASALQVFCDFFDDSMKKIAAITLAARELNCANYPASIIKWNNIDIDGGVVELGLRKEPSQNDFMEKFISTYEAFLSVVSNTDSEVCARLCRGHTAVLILQRLYAASLYHAGKGDDEEAARYDANLFSNVAESSVSAALSEAWIRKVSEGGTLYPQPLVDSVLSVA